MPTIDLIFNELNIIGNLAGNYTEFSELMTLAAQGKVNLATRTYSFDQVHEARSHRGPADGKGILIP